jgi:hypothetical protein
MSTDLLVSFDTTGSMSPCIAEVRRRIMEMLPKLFSSIPELRIGMIAHGDYCDEPNAIFKQPFTSDQAELEKFVKTAPNTSGGDSNEFYELILKLAQEFNWQADNKIFMLIADALPHQVGYTYGRRTYNIDWRVEVQKLADLGVSIYPVQALGSSYSRPFYNELASYSNGKKVDLNQFTESVETIIAITYHKVGRLEEYKDELVSEFRMNRNLVALFGSLDADVSTKDFTTYTRADASGLVPVPPTRFQILHVDHDVDIKTFVLSQGVVFRQGRGFYQFTKSEMIQEHKEVILRNKVTGDMFTGAEARNFIGLPFGIRGQIRPKMFDDYEVYVQSTSNNRKLIHGTKFLYENDVK